jgi:hypothetical protein
VHFCYEADRGTMVTTDMLKKVRAYYHFIKKEQKHKEAFGVHPIRAVLIETTDENRGNKLMELVSHPLVAGPQKRAGRFWFPFPRCLPIRGMVLPSPAISTTLSVFLIQSGPSPIAPCVP